MESTPKSANRQKKPITKLTTCAIPRGFALENSKHDHFDTVQGRLTMANENVYYRVTSEEMRRRIDGVENLNASSMACNLRRTKENGGGERLRKELDAKDIQIVRNRRQDTHYGNAVIAMCEAEAVHMARDLEDVSESIYPAKEIAKEVLDEACAGEEGITVDELDDFKRCMAAMTNIFAVAVPPITGIRPRSSTSRGLNHGMEELSQATHGFGVASQPNWIRQMLLIGDEMMGVLKNENAEEDKKKKKEKEQKEKHEAQEKE